MSKGARALTEELIRIGVLHTPRLIAAFRAVDRADFVPPEVRREAYENIPLPIGFGQTISQPLTVVLMLEWLDPQPEEKILDIGAGSGWQAALIAHAVGPHGRVVAVERIPELAAFARTNLARYPALSRRVTVRVANGARGAPEEAPFDRIVAAAAGREIPPAWKKQVKIGGRIVVPVGNSIVALDKIAENEFTKSVHEGFAFVPLVEDAG